MSAAAAVGVNGVAKKRLQHKIVHVGIAGVTCGGKSTLASQLKSSLADVAEVKIVHQDDFYLPEDQLPRLPELNYWNFDIPDSINWCRLIDQINFTPTPDDDYKVVVVIVEGNLLFSNNEVAKLFDRRYFLQSQLDEIQSIRSSRTYDPPDVPGYFDKVVWPSYLQSKGDAEANGLPMAILDALDYETNFQRIHMDLRRLISDDWVLISPNPLAMAKATEFVTSSSCGAISIFIGTTRDSFQGRSVLKLSYEAYEPMAKQQLYQLCEEVRSKWSSIEKIAIFHRLGEVPVTEASVIIAASSPHRKDSQEATQYAIDRLKATVPIWKKEIYSDGIGTWKENVECPWATGTSASTL